MIQFYLLVLCRQKSALRAEKSHGIAGLLLTYHISSAHWTRSQRSPPDHRRYSPSILRITSLPIWKFEFLQQLTVVLLFSNLTFLLFSFTIFFVSHELNHTWNSLRRRPSLNNLQPRNVVNWSTQTRGDQFKRSEFLIFYSNPFEALWNCNHITVHLLSSYVEHRYLTDLWYYVPYY